MEFIEYSKCSTCKKAKKFLDDNNIVYIDREIKEYCPTKEEISNWINDYNININKLFNTSGLIYRNLNLKDKLNSMSDIEKIELLTNNAMLDEFFKNSYADDLIIENGVYDKENNIINIIDPNYDIIINGYSYFSNINISKIIIKNVIN